MADHRKSFRPRRLTIDGRDLPCGRRLGTVVAFLCALILAPNAAYSQEIGLKRGEASLDSGQYDAAVRQLSATVNDSDSTQEQVVRALYLRGIAYRRLGQTGQAVSDLGAAVWLGLPPSDKVRALVNKGLAYRAAGLSSQAEQALAQARQSSSSSTVEGIIAKDGGRGPVASTSDVGEGAPSRSVWDRIVPSFGSSSPAPSASEPEPQKQTAAAPAPPAEAPATGWGAEVSDASRESGSAVSRWFGSLTGDSTPAPLVPSAANPIPPPTSSTAPRATTASRTTTAARTSAATPPSAASWAANTETEREGERGTALGRWFSRQTSSEPAAAPALPSRGYTVQLANSRSQAEAQALWKKARTADSQLASATPRIEKVELGSFGTFYSVKIGPFASEAAGSRVCNALKRQGTDCTVVSPDGP
jgi:hypothetical protein